MKKVSIQNVLLGTLVCCALLFSACAPSRSVRITELFEPQYTPNFKHEISDRKDKNSNYTIGIIELEFIENKTQNAWVLGSPGEKQLLAEFKRNISNALEKILLSKGNNVAGPFTSYEEMTFPERDRCTFLIKPTFILDLKLLRPTFVKMPDVGGPNLEAYAYASGNSSITGNVQMEYVILDPLTKEKLERHKLKTKEIDTTFKEIAQGVYDDKGNPGKYESLYRFARKRGDRNLASIYDRNYAPLNASAKILEGLYAEFIPKANNLISVEEFDHLKKYQEKLKTKKRY